MNIMKIRISFCIDAINSGIPVSIFDFVLFNNCVGEKKRDQTARNWWVGT